MIPFDAEDFLLLCLLGGVTLVALTAIIGGFLHVRRERYLTHTERMKALELGREMPDNAAGTRARTSAVAKDAGGEDSLTRKCFSTIIWVVLFGFGASVQTANSAVSVAIASAAGAVCVTALICGTILAIHERTVARRSGRYARFDHKFTSDPDAYDVVSQRG
jgi:hypothetical protein